MGQDCPSVHLYMMHSNNNNNNMQQIQAVVAENTHVINFQWAMEYHKMCAQKCPHVVQDKGTITYSYVE